LPLTKNKTQEEEKTMKKYLVTCFFVAFMFMMTGIPFQVLQFDLTQSVYAMGGHGGNKSSANSNGNGNGNGNAYAYGHSKSKSSHGVPDPGTALTLLGIGMAAVGGYAFYRKRK